MNAEYKNWVPKGMICGFLAGAVIVLILTLIFGILPILPSTTARMILGILFGILTLALTVATIWLYLMHRAFSYNGKRKMSKQIIEGIAEYVRIPDGGTCLDVGCGSGALAIACAKRNPHAFVIGIDRWGKEYASFNKALCEKNSHAEGVSMNTEFRQGDATKLDFEDETFDCVTSNYVYHNIPSNDRQKILFETLRTLKKGGVFALHDIMSKNKYGDIREFAKKLLSMGYEDVQLIDTTKGMFMTPFEAKWMGLSGSTLLVGKK